MQKISWTSTIEFSSFKGIYVQRKRDREGWRKKSSQSLFSTPASTFQFFNFISLSLSLSTQNFFLFCKVNKWRTTEAMTMLTLCCAQLKGSRACRSYKEGNFPNYRPFSSPQAFSALFINFNLNNRIINLSHN
jgi:hypothetical protein